MNLTADSCECCEVGEEDDVDLVLCPSCALYFCDYCLEDCHEGYCDGDVQRWSDARKAELYGLVKV